MIDRSNFFKIGDKKIHQDHNEVLRLVSKGDVSVYKYKDYDNINFIKQLNYQIEDNMININSFDVKQKIEERFLFEKPSIIRN